MRLAAPFIARQSQPRGGQRPSRGLLSGPVSRTKPQSRPTQRAARLAPRCRFPANTSAKRPVRAPAKATTRLALGAKPQKPCPGKQGRPSSRADRCQSVVPVGTWATAIYTTGPRQGQTASLTTGRLLGLCAPLRASARFGAASRLSGLCAPCRVAWGLKRPAARPSQSFSGLAAVLKRFLTPALSETCRS